MTEFDQAVPLFPLNTVLYPGGPLNLRVFEIRYINMVRDCAAADGYFGVCMEREDHEDLGFCRLGTLAKLEDFYTTEDGLLGVLVRGQKRFRCKNVFKSDDMLWRGVIESLDEESIPVPPEYSLLVSVALRLVEKMSERYPGAEKEQFDDAAWLSCRLAEILPLQLDEKQALLESDDPCQRLQKLAEYLPRFQQE